MNPFINLKFFKDKLFLCAFLVFGAFVQNDRLSIVILKGETLKNLQN